MHLQAADQQNLRHHGQEDRGECEIRLAPTFADPFLQNSQRNSKSLASGTGYQRWTKQGRNREIDGMVLNFGW